MSPRVFPRSLGFQGPLPYLYFGWEVRRQVPCIFSAGGLGKVGKCTFIGSSWYLLAQASCTRSRHVPRRGRSVFPANDHALGLSFLFEATRPLATAPTQFGRQGGKCPAQSYLHQLGKVGNSTNGRPAYPHMVIIAFGALLLN